MGFFDYPSPYWSNISDEALDLIDKMLTVNPDERITVYAALEHPWITQRKIGLGDSAESLAGAFNGMGFNKRKVERERTLLSHAVKNSRKKPEAEKPVIAQEVEAASEQVTENGAPAPASTTAFMKVGGKGMHETLYRETDSQRSEKPEFPLF